MKSKIGVVTRTEIISFEDRFDLYLTLTQNSKRKTCIAESRVCRVANAEKDRENNIKEMLIQS